MADILTEAFKELHLLREEAFEADKSGIEKMADFLGGDELETGRTAIDPKAKDEEDLEDSYVGKVIFKCPSCRTLIYHDRDRIEFDEDSALANISDACPYCSSVGGFEIIGEVTPYTDPEIKTDGEVEEKEGIEESRGRARRLKEFLETIDSFKTWEFKDKTEQGYEVKKLYKDLDDNRLHVIAYRPGRQDYIVGIGYNPDGGYWNQGRYDFETFKDAEDSLKGDYRVTVYECTDGSLEEAKHVAPRSRDDIDAIADDKKERAAARYMRRKDDADSNRDYQLKKNDLKEEIVHGNPVVTWKVEDEERYEDGDVNETPADLAAYYAYLVNKAGEKLYAFGGADEEDGSMMLDIEGDGKLRKYYFTRGRLYLDESRKNKTLKEADKPAATSIEDAQKWVDFDMEKYGKISERTSYLVKKAGFQIVKDDHGDYEVAAGHFESLQEAAITPDYTLEEDDYVFHEDTGDIAIYSDLVDFEPDRHIRIRFTEDNSDKVYDYKMKELSDDGDFVECEYVSDKITEARDLTKTPGTLAKLFSDHMEEINHAAVSLPALKLALKDIVTESSLANTPAAKKFLAIMDSTKSASALLSTIGTYFTGMKSEALAEDVGSWMAAKKLDKMQKKIDQGKLNAADNVVSKQMDYLQARAEKGAKQADPNTGKGPNATQRVLNRNAAQSQKRAKKKASDERVTTSAKDMLKKLKDTLGLKSDDEVRKVLKMLGKGLAEAYKLPVAKLKESFEKLELETASEKIKVESVPKETPTEEEAIKPITDETAEEIVAENSEKDIAIDKIDDSEIEGLGESYFKKVYENVNSFKVTNSTLTDNQIVVEGLITFNSGKSLKSTFNFAPSHTTKTGKVKFLGENKQIARNKNAFTLTGRVDNGKLLTESLTYNYNAKNGAKTQRVYGRVTKTENK